LRFSTGRQRPCVALTLIELLLTLVFLSILATVLIPHLSADVPDRLSAASQVILADLDYARSLAVANGTSYRLTFDVANNQYDLRHSGANTAFNTLPKSPYRQPDDPADKQTTKLTLLPLPPPGVKLVAVVQMATALQTTTTLEFNSLGGTTSPYQTVIWLSCGSGNLLRFGCIQVDPITGLATIGSLATALPAAVSAQAAGGSE
jgi:type II secretory pathway pseudopilin PulG